MKLLSSERLGSLALLVVLTCGCDSSTASKSGNSPSDPGAPRTINLLNVSYDPTRELWKALNAGFIAENAKASKDELSIEPSHGGSSSQARAVIEGLEADVVTLAMWADTEAIHKAGLINDGWEEKFPNGSLPYFSTIVFVVRKGNPKQIKDWPDLVKEGVEIITPNPKTSGNGKLSFLAAWGSVVLRTGTEDQAKEFVTKLYQQTPVLDTGARGATMTFAKKGIGDVHLTWENEAHFEVAEAQGELEIVYPPISIRAEPRVALVDANVDKKGTREVATAYLNYLYTDEAQKIIAQQHYRPSKPEILQEFSKSLPEIELFSIKDISTGWADAEKFFASEGLFDQIYAPKQ